MRSLRRTSCARRSCVPANDFVTSSQLFGSLLRNTCQGSGARPSYCYELCNAFFSDSLLLPNLLALPYLRLELWLHKYEMSYSRCVIFLNCEAVEGNNLRLLPSLFHRSVVLSASGRELSFIPTYGLPVILVPDLRHWTPIVSLPNTLTSQSHPSPLSPATVGDAPSHR